MIEKLGDTQDLICISGEGSLLLFLPDSLRSQWSGTDVPTDRQVTANFRWAGPGTPATDYDRACDVTGCIEKIAVGNGEGIVIADDYPVHWMPLPQGGIFLRITDLWEDLRSILPLMEEEMWS